jgi:hypothetical protein
MLRFVAVPSLLLVLYISELFSLTRKCICKKEFWFTITVNKAYAPQQLEGTGGLYERGIFNEEFEKNFGDWLEGG